MKHLQRKKPRKSSCVLEKASWDCIKCFTIHKEFHSICEKFRVELNFPSHRAIRSVHVKQDRHFRAHRNINEAPFYNSLKVLFQDFVNCSFQKESNPKHCTALITADKGRVALANPTRNIPNILTYFH